MGLMKPYLDRYQKIMTAAEYEMDGLKIDGDRFVRSVAAEFMQGGLVYFAGNGGSAGICSHMATDFAKNGKIPALALNDSSALTCIGNDIGFDQVFAEQLKWHGGPADVLIAISSSGNSRDILEAVYAARNIGMCVITLSGFGNDNRLRKLGDYNAYLESDNYGFVETGHAQILHAILDIKMGWQP
ncbi:GmhA Phosphoheptose isomerase [uncultured Caudovirales phage]|uniref:GmhA Phosphoheptose isomerase n=1 Tax=uncultured Caudovirales phage TaxID=2100421 RepID=A0A6J5Q9A7_9CAUD|nr:GmhA Phosphoheptose isomerase [uncultured Caudovirales phage]CAB4210463.1 GmhA Phosphoheptose isomerase [uncultured Caudovirales phage]CAB4223487.1 GmhA Phosphoheptose isomerase [uncultured Caudovirales phage]